MPVEGRTRRDFFSTNILTADRDANCFRVLGILPQISDFLPSGACSPTPDVGYHCSHHCSRDQEIAIIQPQSTGRKRV